jgi:hypothetical protein
MRRALVFLPLLLCGCGARDSLGNNGSTSTPSAVPGDAVPHAAGPAEPAQPAPPQTASLTGLYETGAAPRRSQMCMIERGGSTRFGLVNWGAGNDSCSGNGTAVRQGDVLRLTMTGDSACTIEARIEGTRVVFSASVPAGCAYYCGQGARLGGATFDKTGGAEADALRAEDLAGDRLCSS